MITWIGVPFQSAIFYLTLSEKWFIESPDGFSLNLDFKFFPPASSVEGIKSVPSVCLPVCVYLCTLLAEPFEIRAQNVVDGLTLTISQLRSKLKVIGQSSRSLAWKTWFSDGLACTGTLSYVLWHHVRPHGTSLCDVVISLHYVMKPFDVFWKEYWQGGQTAGRPSTLRRFHLYIFTWMINFSYNNKIDKDLKVTL